MGVQGGVTNVAGYHQDSFPVPAHSAATATEEFNLMFADNAMVIDAIKHVPDDALTGTATNYTNLNLMHGAGGTVTTEAGNIDYLSGKDGVANDNTDFTLTTTTADLTVAAGSVIALQYQKVATGLTIPTGMIHIAWHYV